MTVQLSRRARHTLAIVAATTAAVAAIVFIVSAFASAGRAPAGRFPRLVAAAAPGNWPHVTLPNGTATLSYPPSLHAVAADADAASVAQITSRGTYRAYLNATPKQGGENLRNWAGYRLRLLRADDAVAAHQVAAAQGVSFRGGIGSCVIDTYLTRIGHHSYQEIACLVQGRTSASVVVAAAPAARWTQERPDLLRAVAAYQVR